MFYKCAICLMLSIFPFYFILVHRESDHAFFTLTITIISQNGVDTTTLRKALYHISQTIIDCNLSQTALNMHFAQESPTDLLNLALDFPWLHGPKIIRSRVESYDITTLVVESWYPSSHGYNLLFDNPAQLENVTCSGIIAALEIQENSHINSMALGVCLEEISNEGTCFKTRKVHTERVLCVYLHQRPCKSGIFVNEKSWRLLRKYIATRSVSGNYFAGNTLADSTTLQEFSKYISDLLYLKQLFLISPTNNKRNGTSTGVEYIPHYVPSNSSQSSLMCQHAFTQMSKLFEDDETFTVVISTTGSFERSKLLANSIRYFASQQVISCVLIVWHIPDLPRPADYFIHGKPIIFIPNVRDSLNNRFFPSQFITTKSVLIVDDDIFISSDNLVLLFNAWRLFQHHIVGFFPRWISSSTGISKYIPTNEDHKHSGYPLMLTKGMMLHKKFLHLYNCETPKTFRDIVDLHVNCEDILMNFVVSNYTKKPAPMYVQPMHYIGDYGSSLSGSLFKRGKHEETRSVCIQTFEKMFGFSLLSQSKAVYGAYRSVGIQILLNESYSGVHKHNSYCGREEAAEGCTFLTHLR